MIKKYDINDKIYEVEIEYGEDNLKSCFSRALERLLQQHYCSNIVEKGSSRANEI